MAETTLKTSLTVQVSKEELHRLFLLRLEELTDGIVVRENGVVEKYMGDHPHNGDPIYEPVGRINDKQFETEMAAWSLQYLLNKSKNKKSSYTPSELIVELERRNRLLQEELDEANNIIQKIRNED